jgi:membrane associated rhomboid family serine protease
MEFSITIVIIVITSIVSFMALNNENLLNKLIFYPPAVTERNEWYRFFSSGIIHADFPHLIFNMYALYLFGTGVENRFMEVFGDKGRALYVVMYVLALAVSLIPTYSKNKDNYQYRSLGASGAVSAVVFAYMLFDPMIGIGLFFIPIFIAGFLFGILYLVISQFLDKRGGGRINHSAHIWGALFGVAFVIIACRLFGGYPVVANLIETIKNMDPSKIITFGR